jgi:hypothetical protein
MKSVYHLNQRGHGLPFTPTAQTALNLGITIPCSQCRKQRLMTATLGFCKIHCEVRDKYVDENTVKI